MYFFLDVERRGVDHQVAPVLLVLAAPDQLGVEVGIARVANLLRRNLLLLDERLLLGRQNVLAFGLVVLEGFDGLVGESGGHGFGVMHF